MGQTPSCMPHKEVERARRANSSGPHSQRMSLAQSLSFSLRSPRPSSSPSQPTPQASPTLNSTPSISTATGFSPSRSSLDPAPSPPSPLSLTHHQLHPHKSLSINPDLPCTPPPTSSSSNLPHHSTSLLALLRLKASSLTSSSSSSSASRERRSFLSSTPKGADAAAFPHFCPICYRHFPSILMTTCCQHHTCVDCVQQYVAMRAPEQMTQQQSGGVGGVDGRLWLVGCPMCHQQNGVVFERVGKGEQGRSYAESPRTRELMRKVEEEAQTREALMVNA